MKSLYFVGNEELWSDTWFRELVESLKKSAIHVALFDPTKDAAELKKRLNELNALERVVFSRNIDAAYVLGQLGESLNSSKANQFYVFSDIVNPNSIPRHVSYGGTESDLLKGVDLWDGGQLLEDAFLFELNTPSDQSRSIPLVSTADSAFNMDIFSEDLHKEEDLHTQIDIPDRTVLEKRTVIQPVKTQEDLTLENILNPVDLRKKEEAPAVKVAAPVVPALDVSQLISSMSESVSGEELEVFKRYVSIKDRELREAQAATEALRRQIRYFDERLKKSEEERRNLLLKVESTEIELRTVADKKDENRVQLKSVEGHYDEKIKELQIQLESSQFQAGKLDKKLIDFRERVRNDLQKIRSRERELASRLEIQKRDAEALLSAKDERLLNQKREMDRLEFELDSLKERLMDDAQKGEERRRRVSRALQSLKLAQSILSGLEEDTFQKDDKDKAA